jgi:hypothetical protein
VTAYDIVTCLLKARIVEPEEMAIARQWLCRCISMATKLCDHSNGYTYNNRGSVGSHVFHAVYAEAIYQGLNL